MANGTDNSVDRININLLSLDNATMCFNIKKTVRIEELMLSYCRRRNIPQTFVSFIYNGRVIGADQTALCLNLKEGDVIKVLYRF